MSVEFVASIVSFFFAFWSPGKVLDGGITDDWEENLEVSFLFFFF